MKYFKILFMVIACVSCNSTNSDETRIKVFSWDEIPEKYHLVGETVSFDPEVMDPSRITIVDTVMLLKNTRAPYFVNSYSLITHRKITESITSGKGPEEMLFPGSIVVDGKNAWISDRAQGRINQYRTSDICNSARPKIVKRVQFKGLFNEIYAVPDKPIFVASVKQAQTTTDADSGRFILFDQNGEIIKKFGVFPKSNLEMTSMEKMYGYSGWLACSENRIASVGDLTDIIELYSTDGNLLYRIQGPDNFLPAVKENRVGDYVMIHPTKGSRNAYKAPMIHDDELWVEYNGRLNDQNDVKRDLSFTILVFDTKKGKVLRKYSLDSGIISFDVDFDKQIVYAITDDPEYHIVKFDLNKAVKDE